jgi:4-amino-4-deoxy-L-arabinose transferase-like glycosyltransferase
LARIGKALTPLRVGLVVALAQCIFLWASLPRYGVTSDSPALFWSGDRTLFWLQHLSMPGSLDYTGPDPAGFSTPFQRQPDFRDPEHYPVLPGFFGAVTNWIFHTRLHWVDHIDGHHMGLVLFNGIALLLFCIYACKLLGRGAGIAATLALAFFPVGVGHTPNNAKDWPCAQFYGLTILAAGAGVIHKRPGHLLMAGVFLGVAMAAKFNAVFIAPTLILWAPLAWWALYRKQGPMPASIVGCFLIAPYVAFVVFFVTWPWLYYGRLPQWWEHLSEYVRFMVNYGAGARPTFTLYPFTCLALMTPPLVLLCGLYYLATGWRGRQGFALWSLLFIWCFLPIVRIAVPHSNFYDGNRHFIEYVPAFSVMAGVAAAALARRLWAFLGSDRWRHKLGGWMQTVGTLGAGALAMVCIAWPTLEYHPYETVYYNSLIGGLGGAQRHAIFWMPPPSDIRVIGTEGDYWFSSAREGARDLRALMSSPEDHIAMCGPGREHAKANWAIDPMPHLFETHEAEFPDVRYMYISPRESLCWWRQIRRYEMERPIIKRVERGGGLVYEIVGPKDGKLRSPLSPETWYERHVDPRDGVGLEWEREKAEREKKR